jgi:hypothetical protein
MASLNNLSKAVASLICVFAVRISDLERRSMTENFSWFTSVSQADARMLLRDSFGRLLPDTHSFTIHNHLYI